MSSNSNNVSEKGASIVAGAAQLDEQGTMEIPPKTAIKMSTKNMEERETATVKMSDDATYLRDNGEIVAYVVFSAEGKPQLIQLVDLSEAQLLEAKEVINELIAMKRRKAIQKADKKSPEAKRKAIIKTATREEDDREAL